MSNIISTWSPLDLALPTIPSDVDYALFFVTDKGSYKGLNLNFEEGDWLVYLKKDGIGNWYKTNGIVTFNTSSSHNNPDPGFYTKVRLDNQGNVIAGDYLQEDDLPPHKHYFSDITDRENLVSLIQDVFGQMVANHDDSSVKLNYDSRTKTISAEVNYDGITIGQNEFGELEAVGGGEGGSSTGKISLEKVEDLTSRLETLEKAITANTIITNEGSGLTSEVVEGGTLLNVSIDGTSIRVNAFGELEVNPDFVVNSEGEITSNGGCATHEHTADQITDLKDFVINIVNQYKTIDVTELPIDGTTIIVNNNGTLSAVSTAIAAHQHVMDDIKDLNKAKADTWASDQPIQGDTHVDYTKGAIDLSNFTIGYSIEKISEAIKDITTRVEYTEQMVGKVVPSEPPYLDNNPLSLTYINEKTVYDVLNKQNTIAGSDIIVTTTPIYPANKGYIIVYIDDTPMGSINLNDYNIPGTESDNIKIESIIDSYQDTISFRGFYKSAILSYTSHDLSEGIHTIRFEHTVNEQRYSTATLRFNIYNNINPVASISELNNIVSNAYVSGVHVYQGTGEVSAKILITNAYNAQYMPIDNISFMENDTNRILDAEAIGNGDATCDVKFIATQEDVNKNFVVSIRDFLGNIKTTATIHIPDVIFDNTLDYEKYRYIPIMTGDSYTEFPKYNGGFEKYDVTTALPEIEAVIRDNIARIDNTNYTLRGLGPDYTNQTTEEGYTWINFVFESDFKNNVYMDVVNSLGQPYERNKDGTINNIKIFVGQSSHLVPEVWANGNIPFDGCSTAKGIDFNGLDLFRSDNVRRYVTFGQRPTVESGYIFVKIGISDKTDLDCKVLIDSILESLDE